MKKIILLILLLILAFCVLITYKNKFKNELDNDKKEELISALKCEYKTQPFKAELTEEEKANREIMKEKARQEVEEVLGLKND